VGALIGRIFKVLSFIVVMLVLAVSLTAGWGAWRFRASVPVIEGQLRVRGLSGPVVIARDEHGVPHIFGASDADVFFGLGYAHAQDRLFQMDLVRRAMEGRLAEVVPSFIGGEAVVRADARARILGHHLTAQSIADNFEGPVRAAVDAYAAGVNALLASDSFVPPPEYTLLGIRPEPWDAADTAAMWVYMTEDLVSGAGEEYERRLLADQLTPAQIDAFVADGAGRGARSLAFPDMLAANPGLARASRAPQRPGGVEAGPTPGSNAWVVDGAHTRSGKPLLANDPHLGLRAPNVWYLARLHFPSGDVVGGTIPGGPIVVLGRNERRAWGFTNSGYDVVDYLVRPLDSPAVATHEETIKVRFGQDVTITVRDADEGPILDPAYFNLAPFKEAQVVLRSIADDRDNASASFPYALMTTAGGWDDIVEAGRGFTAPIQNVVYADVDGDIGYLSPGRIPIRDGNGDWVGAIPYDDLPRVLNPRSGVIATANNEAAPADYPYDLPGEFAVHRIARIQARLGETALHDIQSFRSIQLDVVSALAARLLPSLPRARPNTEQGAVLQAMLLRWSGAMTESAPEPLAFAAWFEALHRAIYADEFGDLFPRFNSPRALFVDRVLSGELSQWCDDVTTPSDETCGETMGAALDAAATRLFETYGEDPTVWRWGEAHEALFAHPLLSGAPLLDRLFTVRVPHGGDGASINVGHFYFDGEDFAAIHAGSMRAIYDLADLDASLFVQAPGQSGNPMSPHYRDLAPLWAQGGYFEIDTQWDLRRPPPGMRILELLPAE
jgi:penicillin amidase